MGTSEYPLQRRRHETSKRDVPAGDPEGLENRNAEIEKAVKDLKTSRDIIRKSLSQNNLKTLEAMRQVRGAQ